MFDLDNPQIRNRYVGLYTKFLNNLSLQDVLKGIDKYVLSDQGKYQPGINEIVNYAKTEQSIRQRKEGASSRRIVTEDEMMYNLYLNEMKKEPSKRNEWLIEQCLPSCEIMTNEQAYIKKYGKPRAENEAL